MTTADELFTDTPVAPPSVPVDAPTPDDPDSRLLAHLRSGSWLDAQQFPPMAWAVPGLIPEGFGLFTGPPKAGKSWAALGIALAVSSSTPALGIIETGPPRPVLLLALEDGDRRLQGRCRHLLADEPIPELLDYMTAAAPGDVLPTIGAWLRKHGHRRPLVVLDTLGKVMPPAHPGEGAYQRDYRIGSALKALVDHHPGACLLVVHHVRKAIADDWMDSTSGTNGLNGAADFTLNLSRPRNEDAGLLRVTGRDVPEGEYAVTSDAGRWIIDGDALADAAAKAAELRITATVSDRTAEVLRHVNNADGPVSPKQLAEAISASTPDAGMSNDDAGQYLRRLADSGHIRKQGRGLYTSVRSVRTSESEGDTLRTFGQSDTDQLDAESIVTADHSAPFGHSDTSDTVTAAPQRGTCERCAADIPPRHVLCRDCTAELMTTARAEVAS